MIENILSRLEKVECKGNNKWIACCPSHDDKTPSLTIMDSNGKILIHCFAGCNPIDVIQSVGLSMTDLFPDKGLSDFKGFIQIQREVAEKKLVKEINVIDVERTVLALAKTQRANGNKLSQKDLIREKEAYLKIKEFESSENTNRR